MVRRAALIYDTRGAERARSLARVLSASFDVFASSALQLPGKKWAPSGLSGLYDFLSIGEERQLFDVLFAHASDEWRGFLENRGIRVGSVFVYSGTGVPSSAPQSGGSAWSDGPPVVGIAAPFSSPEECPIRATDMPDLERYLQAQPGAHTPPIPDFCRPRDAHLGRRSIARAVFTALLVYLEARPEELPDDRRTPGTPRSPDVDAWAAEARHTVGTMAWWREAVDHAGIAADEFLADSSVPTGGALPLTAELLRRLRVQVSEIPTPVFDPKAPLTAAALFHELSSLPWLRG